MKKFIVALALIAVTITPTVASANIIFDTRQPKIFYRVDGELVDTHYIVHTTFVYTNPRDKEKEAASVYRCSKGWCGALHTGKDKEAYTYRFEEFSDYIPDTAIKDKGFEYWVKYNYYLNNSESVVNSYDITEELRSIDLTSRKDIIDFYVDIDSETKEVTVEEVNSGPYDPWAEIERNQSEELKWPLTVAALVVLGILASFIVPIVVVYGKKK